MNPEILNQVDSICKAIAAMPLDEQVEALNQVRSRLHQVSPFQSEPVDCVLWVKGENVKENNYNPNSVASPEMKLLDYSVTTYGMGFPVITYPLPLPEGEPEPEISEDPQEIVDGFHRSTVVKKSKKLTSRMHGYLPTAHIKGKRGDLEHRIGATVAYNRARGKHQVELMGQLVAQLKDLGCSDIKIAKSLGMDGEEVLRLKQLTGLADLFANENFSKAWVAYQEGDRPESAQITPV